MNDTTRPLCPEPECVYVRAHEGPHGFFDHDDLGAYVRRTATAILAARLAAKSATPYDAAAAAIRAALCPDSDGWQAPQAWHEALDEADASAELVPVRRDLPSLSAAGTMAPSWSPGDGETR